MVQKCAVPNCTSRYGTLEKISMHRFPLTEPKLVEKWVRAIQRPNWEPTKNSRICCRHFEDNCFWVLLSGKSVLSPLAIPTKFDFISREPNPRSVANRQNFQNTRRPLPPAEEPTSFETTTITQDFVYIKTEPDLYLSENEFIIKEEPQSEPDTENNNCYEKEIKVEDSLERREPEQPLPISFPVVKTEIKEEPEDNTYTLSPSNFARLSSQPPVLDRQELQSDQHQGSKNAESKQPTVQCSPKKPRVRKRRHTREEGLLSDHTYVKFKFGCHIKVGPQIRVGSQVEIGSLENDVSREVVSHSSKLCHVSVQCGESYVRKSRIMKTHKRLKTALGVGVEADKILYANTVSKNCGTNTNFKKENVKIGSPGSAKRVSKFPSVSFSNSNKFKNGLILNTQQRNYSACRKKLSDTFKSDFKRTSSGVEGLGEEDFNKENSICLMIKRDLIEKPLQVLGGGQMSDARNKVPNLEEIKKNVDITEEKKYSESHNVLSSDKDQKLFTSSTLKGNQIVNPARKNHRQRKRLFSSRSKHKKLVQSIKANSNLGNEMTENCGLKNKMTNVNYESHDPHDEVRSCLVEKVHSEETFLNKDVQDKHLCLLCEESFQCQENLRIHVAQHCQKSAFACLHCTKTFVDEEGLRLHVATHVMHKCILCSAELPSKSALCEHVLSHFGEGTVLKCEYCPKIFYGTKLYEEHQLLHAAISECVCQTCDKVFSTEIEYFEHVKSHLKPLSVSTSSRNEEKVVSETVNTDCKSMSGKSNSQECPLSETCCETVTKSNQMINGVFLPSKTTLKMVDACISGKSTKRKFTASELHSKNLDESTPKRVGIPMKEANETVKKKNRLMPKVGISRDLPNSEPRHKTVIGTNTEKIGSVPLKEVNEVVKKKNKLVPKNGIVRGLSSSEPQYKTVMETSTERIGIVPLKEANEAVKKNNKHVPKNGIVRELPSSEPQYKTVTETSTERKGSVLWKVNNKTVQTNNRSTSFTENTDRVKLLCALCSKVCFSETEYQAHVVTHRSRRCFRLARQQLLLACRVVKCMLCEKKFANERVLKKHILTHTGEFPQSLDTLEVLDR